MFDSQPVSNDTFTFGNISITGEEFSDRVAELAIANAYYDRHIEPELMLARKFYKSDQWSEKDARAYNDRIVDNLLYDNVQVSLASLSYSNPTIFVVAKTPPYIKDGQVVDTAANAVIVGHLLDYYVCELRIKEEIDKALIDALIGRAGYIFTGYAVETEVVGSDGTTIQSSEMLKSSSPYVMRISPADIRWEPGIKDQSIYSKGWIAIRQTARLKDVQKDRRYTNTEDLNASGVPTVAGSISGPGADVRSSSFNKRVTLWHIWDRRDRTVLTIADGHDKPLRLINWPFSFKKYPIDELAFNFNPDEEAALSDFAAIRTKQVALNKFWSMYISHVRRVSQRKYMAQAGSISTADVEKLMHGPDGTMVFYNGTGVPIGLLPDATVSQDIYINLKMLREAIRSDNGVGVVDSKLKNEHDMAKEDGQSTGPMAKLAYRQALFEKFWSNILEKLLVITQEVAAPMRLPLNGDQFEAIRGSAVMKDRLLKAVGADNSERLLPWLKVEPGDAEGSYGFKLDVGSTRYESEATLQMRVISLAKLLQGNPYIDGRKATVEILRAFNVSDPESFLKSDELMQKEQQANIEASQKLEQEHIHLKAQTDMLKTKMKTGAAMQMAKEKVQADLMKALLDATNNSETSNASI